MNRYKAASIHLFASGLVLFSIFLLIAYVWYPFKLFSLAAGIDLLKLIVMVDLVAGPLVMLIVFDAKKKWMKLDIAIILACQFVFMAYGLWSMFTARPAFLAFAENHFYLVRANEVEAVDFQKATNLQFNHLPLFGPIYVGTTEPNDPKVKDELVTAFLGGMGIQNLPQYFVPYEQVMDQVVKAGKTSDQLGVDHETKLRVAEYEKLHSTRKVLFLPMVNKLTPLIVVVDAKTGEVIDLI